jgi:hypothetical protein
VDWRDQGDDPERQEPVSSGAIDGKPQPLLENPGLSFLLPQTALLMKRISSHRNQ